MSTDLSLHQETLLAQMEDTLNDLAMGWRGTRDPEEASDIVRRYQAILNCMVELGFRQSLDADAELPDELMPAVYLALFE